MPKTSLTFEEERNLGLSLGAPETKLNGIETLPEFEQAVNAALLNGDDALEVSPKIMLYFTKSEKDKSMTYKGIKVYVEGFREQVEEINGRSSLVQPSVAAP